MSLEYRYLPQVHNTKAAEVIVPKIIALYQPKSVVDVGCGTGTWLRVFKENGILDYLGIDGQKVNSEMRMIEPNHFLLQNLNEPFDIDRRFDLVICLEVAEHLENSASNLLVSSLTSLGDIVIFSAAIPGQDGQHHINEQHPRYWVNLFASRGYFPVEDLGFEVWNDENVEWWYRQNMMILKKDAPVSERVNINLKVHPELFNKKLSEISRLNKEKDRIFAGKIAPASAIKILIKSIVNYLKSLKSE